jgi:hypothetical protein
MAAMAMMPLRRRLVTHRKKVQRPLLGIGLQ